MTKIQNYTRVFILAVKLLRGEVSTTFSMSQLTRQGGLSAPQIRQAMIDQRKRYAPGRSADLAQAMKASPLFFKVKDGRPGHHIVWGAVPDDEIVARLREHNGAVIGHRSIPAHLKRKAGVL